MYETTLAHMSIGIGKYSTSTKLMEQSSAIPKQKLALALCTTITEPILKLFINSFYSLNQYNTSIVHSTKNPHTCMQFRRLNKKPHPAASTLHFPP